MSLYYVALLRGINVGGKKRLKMADLKELLNKNGFEKVQTYIQSGNIVFLHDEQTIGELENTIATLIKEHFFLNVPVLVIKRGDYLKTIDEVPFENVDIDKTHITFLSKIPTLEGSVEDENSGDYYQVIGKAIYLYCEGSYHKSTFSNAFFEKRLKVSCTTRNWKTVTRIYEMLNQ
jgi:uncharacterized protein (DUF1697 family)